MKFSEFDAARALTDPDKTQPLPVLDDPLELTWVMPVPSRRYRMAEGRKQHIDALAQEVESIIRHCPNEGLRAEYDKAKLAQALRRG